MTRRKILIVEDEVLVRCGLRSMVNWEKLGLDVIGDASNGKEALEIYEKEKPDIVMTDIKMPVMDGLELIEKIREQDQSTRIVLLTCYEEFSYLMRAMKLGVSDYILKLKMKPDEIEKAMEKVCKELEQKNPDSKNETKAVQDKSDLFGQYVFYHQINENTFREQLKKLDFQVSEKSYRICRMEIANYKEVCEKTKDEQGALIQFLIFNMTEEILGKYKNGELIRENEKNYLLLIEETEEDNQKTKTILKEIARVLREHIMAQVCWKISGVGRSWTELSDRYQECKKNETEKQKEDQKAQNLKQLSIEIYKAKEYIDQHLADKLTLNQVAEIVCLSPNYFSSMWKKEMQIGFVDYITEQRVEKAKELFATTDLRTHEVAELTGFGGRQLFQQDISEGFRKESRQLQKAEYFMKKDDTVKIPFYKSVFGKMIIAVSLSFLLVIIISFIGLYMGVKGALRTRTETELLRSYKQLEQNLDTFGREVDQVALRVLNGSDLASLVVSHGSQTSMIEQRIDFFSMTDTILAEYSFIDSIVFYNAEDVTLFADGNWNITSENSEKRGKFYTERLKNRNAVPQKKPIWYGGYNSSDFVENDRDNQKLLNYVSVCRPIFRGEKYGWLVLNVDLEHFVSYYNSISEDGGWSEETYMIDQFGRTVSETNVYGIGDEKENLMLQPEAAPKIFESGKNLILCYPVGFCNWTLVNETPISEILGDIQDVQEIFILAIVSSVTISILFLVFWVKYMTTPFVKVIDALKMVQNGQFGIVLEQDHENGDEFSLLVNSYNKMTLEISSLIRKNVENEKSKRDAQIRALKSQINPHFLYNTLNTVKWMAIVKGENDIVDCMDALAEMVQPIFRDTRNKWSVEEELTYIKNYCRIMNYRYGEKTVLGIEADSSLMSAMVPKFILQPLVENSFFHGLAEKEMQEHKKFQIYVKGKRKEYKTRDCLELCVYDNGIGISRENCEKLRASLNMEDDGRHIGLRNIYQRIKLLYDMENGVEIGSDNENGFQVLVRIPYEEEKW